ncbi:MAG TPA: NUDIX hydrolase [Thermomicrobiales bacterium]|nr:NUDIX hydrolase [Thermomicrobiales bacterium]
MASRVGVGVGTVVTRDDAVLLVQRKFHGAGSWSTPGGYLDPGETPEAAALRELLEETGITATNPIVAGISNDIHPDGKHNVTFWVTAQYASGTPTLTAPDELAAVDWFPWEALPAPIYRSFQNYLDGWIYRVSDTVPPS